MKSLIILLASNLILLSCTSNTGGNDEHAGNDQISEVYSHSIIGSLKERTYIRTFYNENREIDELMLQEISSTDTILSRFRVFYDFQNRVSKIDRQIISEPLNHDDSIYEYLKIEYFNNEILSLRYSDFLIRDFIYENGLAISYKLYYHINNTIDSSKTRLFEMKYDNARNVIGLSDTRISDGLLFADISIAYDLYTNPLQSSVLCLIPSFDFLVFQSSNNPVEVKSRNEKSVIKDYNIERKYSSQGLWESSRTEFVGGAILLDSIVYSPAQK